MLRAFPNTWQLLDLPLTSSARFLVRGGRFDAMEGSSRERNIVVEFRDYGTAIACYRSPEYQSAKVIRNANADADLIIVAGDGA
jgi:uncharacterized protein (DUF1330 family)